MADYGNRSRAVFGGALMGFADELEAALRSGRISGPEYRSARDSIRQNYGAYEEANPYEAGGLSMAGSILPFLVPGVGPALAGGRGALSMGRLAAAGAGYGAVEGAGSAAEMSDIPVDAVVGASMGAALGPLFAVPGAAKKAHAFRGGKKAERELYDLLNRYVGV